MAEFIFRKNDEIGKLEAETDSFLDKCFYETAVFKGLLDFDKTESNSDFTRRIIVGRTGSGKTALLKKIASTNSIKKYAKIEAENTIFEHINNNTFVAKLSDGGIDLRSFYKSLWLHILVVKVVSVIFDNKEESFLDAVKNLIGSSRKKKYRQEIALEYIENFGAVFFNDNAIIEISSKFQSELSTKLGPDILGFSGKLSSDDKTKVQHETSSYVSRELIKRQKEIINILEEEYSDANQIRIVISIDDLDKSWLSSSDIRYDFINSLLEAFRELLSISSVKILISIRTDILMGIYENTLRQNEKDQSLIYPISWNKEEIREILDYRINHLVKNKYQSSQDVTMKDIFNFSVNDAPADEYILDRTMMRPRDAINFVNLCLAQSDGKVVMSKDHVLAAEESFYESRKKALITEWVSIYKNIKEYVDAIVFLSCNEFTIESVDNSECGGKISSFLESKSSNSKEDDLYEKVMTDFRELVEIWFTIGVVGIWKTPTITIYSSFDKPHLDISDLNRKFILHPLFDRVG